MVGLVCVSVCALLFALHVENCLSWGKAKAGKRESGAGVGWAVFGVGNELD